MKNSEILRNNMLREIRQKNKENETGLKTINFGASKPGTMGSAPPGSALDYLK